MVVNVLLKPLQMICSLVTIEFNNASIIDKGSHRIRKFLESRHTMTIPLMQMSLTSLFTGQYNKLISKNF